MPNGYHFANDDVAFQVHAGKSNNILILGEDTLNSQ